MRLLPVIALSASLLTGACTDQYGNPDYGATLGLAAGAAALGGIAYLAAQDDDGPRYRDRGHGRARRYDSRMEHSHGRRGYYR